MIVVRTFFRLIATYLVVVPMIFELIIALIVWDSKVIKGVEYYLDIIWK